MPYHAEAAGMTWYAIDSNFQYLFMAGMKIAGTGFILSSLTIAFLQSRIRKDQVKWIPLLILFIGTMSYIGSISAILIVKFNTSGNPPYLLATVGWLLVVVGFYGNANQGKNYIDN